MALFVVRGLSRSNLVKLCTNTNFNLVQTANITSTGGQARPKQLKPFDYRHRKFRYIHQPFDRTESRMDENSKVIVIDGPMAAGKSEFAERLAKQLDFKYVPQPDIKKMWKVGKGGLTYQDLDDLLPPEHRIYDLESFYKDPKPRVAEGGGRGGELQLDFFSARLFAYNDALLHLLSTGQGVVCVRSPWSDRVFAKALYENGLMSRAGFDYYTKTIARNHLCDYPRPHLVIYLDADVQQTKENIKKRNNPAEVDSKILTDGYLQSIENEYKDVILPALESHSALLVYPAIPDISEHEIALMTEDIEALGDLKHSGIADDRFLEDWLNMRDEELAHKRRRYQDLELARGVLHHPRPWNAPEMCQTDDWLSARRKVYHSVPGYKFEPGFDPQMYPAWQIAMGIRGCKLEDNERREFWIPA